MRWIFPTAMSPKRSSAAPPGDPPRRRRGCESLPRRRFLAVVAILAGCSRAPVSRDAEFTVATYNLNLYGDFDRARDPEIRRSEPKPAAERAAVADTIAAARPDILALQEIGTESDLAELIAALEQRGLRYPHREYLRRGTSGMNLALLSRFPIRERRPRVNDVYTIGGETWPVLRGFIDADIDVDGVTLRVFAAHLKSRVFHPLGQTEMRRNEARLLANYARQALRENPDARVLVAGDLNDTWNSAPLRLLCGEESAPLLHDLRPADNPCGVWTCAVAGDDSYVRIDYLLVSPALRRQFVPGSAQVFRDSPAEKASDHRLVIARFRRSRAP